MGVSVLSPESRHNKHLRSLPKLPPNSHYLVKPANAVKHTRALPAVPNTSLAVKMDQNAKQGRALPRVPKPPIDKKAANSYNRHARVLPELPFKDALNSTYKDTNSSVSSRGSSPKSHQQQQPHHHQNNKNNKNNNNQGHHTHQHKTGSTAQHHHTKEHNHENHKHHHNHHNNNHVNVPNNNNMTIHPQRALPKLPKKAAKQKPEQNRIEYMHDTYKKEGDLLSEEGNYEQALKSYNLALKFISDDKATMIARSRVYRKLGKPRKAMQDVDTALKLDPIYYEGLLQKGELLLEQGDFDSALSCFQKGARMRPDRDDFQDGIEKAKHGMSEYHHHKGPEKRKRKHTVSPEDNNVQKKSKDKSKKNRDNTNVQARTSSFVSEDLHNNSYISNSSSNRESIMQEDAPPIMPAPPTQPPPTNSRAKLMLSRQMTPMPGKFKHTTRQLHESNQQQQQQQQPKMMVPREEDVDEDMMKQILGKMYTDKHYLEKLLGDPDEIGLPSNVNLGTTAEGGLHFLYDRVLNWVRKGEPVPVVQPTPLPRETKTSARRKAMMHGSSVESLLEDAEKENEQFLLKRRRKRKVQTKAPHTWYSYLENKKLEEAQERKQSRNIFLHVVEGQKITPKDTADPKKSKLGPDGSRLVRQRNQKEFGSKESLNQSFFFKSYRPGSDMRSSKESKVTSMDTSDQEDKRQRTPPKKTKKFSDPKTEKIERRRAAVAKFVAREMEDVELAYAENKYDECTEKANHILKILEQEEWPGKYVAMATLTSFLGNACIGRKDYTGALEYHNKDLQIGEANKIEDSVSRALGNLGRIYVVKRQHQQALDMFLRKTPMCTSRIETAWLFHEIGNCFLALGDFEYAKDAAKKSLEAAEEAVEWSYQLQSCVLMGVAEVKLKQYHAAFNTFERALDQARLQGDEKAEEAIREALQDVNDRIVEELRTKGPMNFQEGRSDMFLTPISRGSTSLTDYQLGGLSRSRAEIAKRHAELGYRCRADYAKTPGMQSDYSSILIPDDDGDVSLTDTHVDPSELNLDLERLRTDSTIFGSAMDYRDNIQSEMFVSGRHK